MENKEVNHAKKLAQAIQARTCLYICGFITETENDKIHNRLVSYQDKYKVDGALIKNELRELP